MTKKILNQIEAYMKSLPWTPGNFYWKHAFFVRKYALILQKQFGGDKDIIEASALLHDIGKNKLLAEGHEKISSKYAEKFLKKINFPKQKIKSVCKSISYENFDSIESKILISADSIALFMDKKGQKFYFEKILKNKKKNILTELKNSYNNIIYGKEIVKKAYEDSIYQHKNN